MTVRFISDTFTKHLFWLLCGALLSVAAGWWIYSAYQLEDVLIRQISLRAQVQSQQLAHMPSLITAIENNSASQVTQLIDHFAKVTDADFITVSDKQGIRLAHPVHDRVGLPVMGGDIEDALNEGKSYLSYASGSLGPSVRYISPIFDHRLHHHHPATIHPHHVGVFILLQTRQLLLTQWSRNEIF